MTFHVGQEVICVDVSQPPTFEEGLIEKYRVYTIKRMDCFPSTSFVVMLEGEDERWWRAWRFRPLERKSLEVFDGALTREPETALT